MSDETTPIGPAVSDDEGPVSFTRDEAVALSEAMEDSHSVPSAEPPERAFYEDREFTQLTPLDPQTFTMCERPGCFNTCVRGNLNCREHVQPSFIQRRHGYGCPCAACNAPK